jgi:threonine aldolase
MDPVVDLRSDTVTRPSDAMREAMATAEVGDDVWGEDPTVIELEQRTAGLVGKAAGLYVTSGTMGNQLALRSHTESGQQLICHADAHIQRYEAGAPAALSGLQVSTIATVDGSMPWSLVEPEIHPDDVHCAPARLVAFENTHNRCGGRVQDQTVLADCARHLRDRGLRTHLDGARLFNAAAATGLSPAVLSAPVDSVSLCFSKGMGAPVGSVLAGSEELIRRARRFRKQWGGGMRQAGILAAACLFALDHNLDRIEQDHRHARVLADRVEHPQWRLRATPESNIVLWDLQGERDSAWFERDLAGAGILVSSFGPRTVRMVTHLDVGTAEIDRAIETVNSRGRSAAAEGDR